MSYLAPFLVENHQFWPTVCKTIRPILLDRCLSCLSCLSVTLYCGQTVGWIKMKLSTQAVLGPDHIVLDRNPAPPPPKGHSPQFSAHICCGEMAGWIKMPFGMKVGLDPSDIVLHRDPAPSQNRGRAPQFSAHVYRGQTAGWIKMPLGTKVGLSPGQIVLYEDLAPPKGAHPQIFGPCLLWPDGRPSQLLLITCILPHLYLAPPFRMIQF